MNREKRGPRQFLRLEMEGVGTCPILQAFGQIIDDLEEAQMNMQTLLSMRHVGPFSASLRVQLTAFSDTADTLEYNYYGSSVHGHVSVSF